MIYHPFHPPLLILLCVFCLFFSNCHYNSFKIYYHLYLIPGQVSPSPPPSILGEEGQKQGLVLESSIRLLQPGAVGRSCAGGLIWPGAAVVGAHRFLHPLLASSQERGSQARNRHWEEEIARHHCCPWLSQAPHGAAPYSVAQEQFISW